jgi:hypothetical protein
LSGPKDASIKELMGEFNQPSGGIFLHLVMELRREKDCFVTASTRRLGFCSIKRWMTGGIEVFSIQLNLRKATRPFVYHASLSQLEEPEEFLQK